MITFRHGERDQQEARSGDGRRNAVRRAEGGGAGRSEQRTIVEPVLVLTRLPGGLKMRVVSQKMRKVILETFCFVKI